MSASSASPLKPVSSASIKIPKFGTEFKAERPKFLADGEQQSRTRKGLSKALHPLVRITTGPLKKGAKSLIKSIVIPLADDDDKTRAAQKKTRDQFLEGNDQATKVSIETFDEVKLDGAAVFCRPEEKEQFIMGDGKNQKWIIVVNGNSEYYEETLKEHTELAKSFNANVLAFNYRGVGQSEGNPEKFDDLIIDADACVQYLIAKGVPEDQIIIKGHSLGGGVATKVASLYEKVNLINTNSYASISKVAEVHAKIPLIKKLVAKIVKNSGWDVDVVAAWNNVKGKKMVVFHKDDPVIPKASSLFKGLKLDKKRRAKEGMEEAQSKSTENQKFGGEYLKITRKVSVYKEEFVGLPPHITFVLHDTPEEFRENLRLKMAEEIRQTLAREINANPLQDDVYERNVNRPIEIINQFGRNFPSLTRVSEYKEPIEDYESFKKTLEEEIATIEKYLKDNPAIPVKIRSEIERIKRYFENKLKKLEEIPRFENVKPIEQKMRAHNYMLDEDKAAWKRIKDFAKGIFTEKDQ